jgi:hypothetical protein
MGRMKKSLDDLAALIEGFLAQTGLTAPADRSSPFSLHRRLDADAATQGSGLPRIRA